MVHARWMRERGVLVANMCMCVLYDGGFWVGQCYTAFKHLLVSGYWQSWWWRGWERRPSSQVDLSSHTSLDTMMIFFMYMLWIHLLLCEEYERRFWAGRCQKKTMGHLMSNWRFQYRFCTLSLCLQRFILANSTISTIG